jgi:hypothetical protein
MFKYELQLSIKLFHKIHNTRGWCLKEQKVREKYCRTLTTVHFALKREMGPIIEKGWVIISFEGV